MINSKMLTISLTYKLKTSKDFNTACEEFCSSIKRLIEDEEFDAYMHIVTKEVVVTISKLQKPEVELLITMFTTLEDTTIKDAKLFRAYSEENLVRITQDNVSAKLIKRRIY